MQNHLLIDDFREKIVKDISSKNNRVILIRGQTGCGKSTKIPQFILEDIIKSGKGSVQVLLPRTVTTSSLAVYMKDKVKGGVSCRCRFNNEGNDNAKLKYMTISWFLNYITSDKKNLIKDLSYVIIDDVNERSIETDILMGKMKEYLRENKLLKLIIMSALFNVEAMRSFYEKLNPVFIDIPRKPCDIKIRYDNCKGEEYISEIVKKIIDITIEEFKKKNIQNGNIRKSKQKKQNPSHHILVFLPTESKVLKMKDELKEALNYLMSITSGDKKITNKFQHVKVSQSKECLKYIFDIEIHKVFSNMVPEEKERLFHSQSKQKVIISTNVLENGLTIPDLKYVIDCGRVSRITYDNINNAVITAAGRISVAEAEQRKGLLVRNNGGECIRMYENPFSLIVPIFIEQKINEVKSVETNEIRQKSNEFSEVFHIYSNLFKKEEFLTNFYYTLHSYFEISFDESRENSGEISANDLEALRTILKFIYPKVKLENYKSIIEFIVHKIMNCKENFMVDAKANIEVGVLPPPHVSHCDFMQLIVRLLGLGESDIFNFPFLDKPDEEELKFAAERLVNLSIIERKKNRIYKLTNLGRNIVRFPLDPRMAKVVHMASKTSFTRQENLFYETVYISALEGMNSLFLKWRSHKLDDEHGDLFKFLNLWYNWPKDDNGKRYCKDNGLNYSNLCYAYKVVGQLKHKQNKKEIQINNVNAWKWLGMLFMSGYSHNIAVKTTICENCLKGERKIDCTCLYRVLYSGCEAVIDRRSCIQKFRRDGLNYNVILFLTMSKSATDKKNTYRLRNILSLESEDVFGYPFKKFNVHGDLWKNNMDKMSPNF